MGWLKTDFYVDRLLCNFSVLLGLNIFRCMDKRVSYGEVDANHGVHLVYLKVGSMLSQITDDQDSEILARILTVGTKKSLMSMDVLEVKGKI